MATNERLSKIFANRAEQLNLSTKVLAQRLGVSETRVRQLLRSEHLREDTIHRLAEAMGLRLSLSLALAEDLEGGG